MSEARVKKGWKNFSTKKKIIIIVLCVVAFLLIAAVCTGLGVLHWYCANPTSEVVSGRMVATNDTELIAHRGFRCVAPENTAPAFEEAGKRGMYGAECDVYMTKDGVWVIQHDPITYRMMNCTKNIEKCTYDQLMKYNTDNGNNVENYPDLKICTLDEYLDICEKYEMTAVIEIKGKNNVEHYDKIIDSVNNHKCNVIFISFHAENLVAMRKLTDAQMFYLVQEIDEDDIEIAKSIENCGIDFNGNEDDNYDDNSEIIKKCQEAGLVLGAWTINDVALMQQLVDLGIEYITTDCIEY